MSKKPRNVSFPDRYTEIVEVFERVLPDVFRLQADESDFIGLHFKRQLDGTVLAVAKQYGSDGAEMVCFGGGYGVIGALLTIDAAISGNRWRKDKPWSPPEK